MELPDHLADGKKQNMVKKVLKGIHYRIFKYLN